MANSSYTGMHLVDMARSHGDLAPVLPDRWILRDCRSQCYKRYHD